VGLRCDPACVASKGPCADTYAGRESIKCEDPEAAAGIIDARQNVNCSEVEVAAVAYADMPYADRRCSDENLRRLCGDRNRHPFHSSHKRRDLPGGSINNTLGGMSVGR
jgi:hypothetical protein